MASADVSVPGVAGGPAGREPQVRLVLWRHGQTAWNAEGRFQGHRDVPLDAAGWEQAERAAPYLAAMRPVAIVSSDLARAAQTAAALARITGLSVQFDEDLRERFGGGWEGLTGAEIRASSPPQAVAAWVPPDGESSSAVADRAASALVRIADGLADGTLAGSSAPGGAGSRDGAGAPGGAGLPALGHAAADMVPGAAGGRPDGARLPDRPWSGPPPAGPLAVVVSHGAAIGLALFRLFGLPEQDRPFGTLGNCSWSVLGCRNGRWRLLAHNVGVLPEPGREVIEAGDTVEAAAPLPGEAPASAR
jgi:broad specificity phosphatase PhoE